MEVAVSDDGAIPSTPVGQSLQLVIEPSCLSMVREHREIGSLAVVPTVSLGQSLVHNWTSIAVMHATLLKPKNTRGYGTECDLTVDDRWALSPSRFS